jgi:hypothetical protein
LIFWSPIASKKLMRWVSLYVLFMTMFCMWVLFHSWSKKQTKMLDMLANPMRSLFCTWPCFVFAGGECFNVPLVSTKWYLVPYCVG